MFVGTANVRGRGRDEISFFHCGNFGLSFFECVMIEQAEFLLAVRCWICKNSQDFACSYTRLSYFCIKFTFLLFLFETVL